MLTASFSEARQNLTEIADRVANEGVEYTIFKRSKPLFKIVPVDAPESENEAASHRVSMTRQEAARRAAERAQEGADNRETQRARALEVLDASPRGRDIPDSGMELFEYAMRLRERMPIRTPLSTLTPEGLKRELANRDV